MTILREGAGADCSIELMEDAMNVSAFLLARGGHRCADALGRAHRGVFHEPAAFLSMGTRCFTQRQTSLYPSLASVRRRRTPFSVQTGMPSAENQSSTGKLLRSTKLSSMQITFEPPPGRPLHASICLLGPLPRQPPLPLRSRPPIRTRRPWFSGAMKPRTLWSIWRAEYGQLLELS